MQNRRAFTLGLFSLLGTSASANDPWPYQLAPVTIDAHFLTQAYNPIPELPRVVITGRRCDADAACMMLLDQLQAMALTQQQLAIQEELRNPSDYSVLVVTTPIDKPLDVRSNCSIPGKQELASTTSQSDAITRQDAVRSLVGANAIFWTIRLIISRIQGTTVVINGTRMISATFEFADGGRERYYLNPLSSNNAESAGNLELGTGVPANVPCNPGGGA